MGSGQSIRPNKSKNLEMFLFMNKLIGPFDPSIYDTVVKLLKEKNYAELDVYIDDLFKDDELTISYLNRFTTVKKMDFAFI